MLENAYDTILGIIFSDLPKKEVAKGKFLPTIYDRPIDGWYFGDRSVIPQVDVPAISIHGVDITPKFKAFRTRQQEYQFTVTCYAQNKSKELSERDILEFAHLVNEVFRSHRYIWVCALCPFTESRILSPEYYLNHPDINEVLQPYVAQVSIMLKERWDETQAHLPQPAIQRSRLAAYAYSFFWNDVKLASETYGAWESVPDDNTMKTALNTLPASYNKKAIYNRIVNMIKFKRKPVRLLADVVATKVKPTDDGDGKALLYSATFDIQAKELYKEINFGPDNVPIVGG